MIGQELLEQFCASLEEGPGPVGDQRMRCNQVQDVVSEHLMVRVHPLYIQQRYLTNRLVNKIKIILDIPHLVTYGSVPTVSIAQNGDDSVGEPRVSDVPLQWVGGGLVVVVAAAHPHVTSETGHIDSSAEPMNIVLKVEFRVEETILLNQPSLLG